MNIVLHCGGMPFNGDTIKHKSLGGSESAAYYMAKELAAQGHQVMLFTNSEQGGDFDGVHYTWAGVPSQSAPFGERFHVYAVNTPHDVLIMQRHPHAFRYPWQAKLKFWWLHDIAQGRLRDEVARMMWNLDGILCVSEWHRKQVMETWGLPDNIVHAIQNGVDLSLYDKEIEMTIPSTKFNLLHTARPERGLINLVKENGIMEQLLAKVPEAHLYLATYDNQAPQLQELYMYLEERVSTLPNITWLGALTKKQLADVQRQCDLYVYPTTFEDTSCITMMECMAARLPVIASNVAALSETCRQPSGCIMVDNTPEGVDISKFVDLVEDQYRLRDTDGVRAARRTQGEAAKKFDWSIAAAMVDSIIHKTFANLTANNTTLAKHYIHTSDIYAAQNLLEGKNYDNQIFSSVLLELEDCYSFAFQNNWKIHYEKYYEYEKNRGVNYGPENLSGNVRFECVADHVSQRCPGGGVVLDYGCAHGHYTVNLAKRFPDRKFIGIDITQSNIDKARQWAKDEGITNVEFHCAQVFKTDQGWKTDAALGQVADVVIAAEVLEHVEQPGELAKALQEFMMKPTGQMIITVPYGPWEARGYVQHWPWRAHVHHMEREDLQELFGHWPDFNTYATSSGLNEDGEVCGSYIIVVGHAGDRLSGEIDYARKHRTQAPRQTLSVCIMVKDGESCLRRCLDSVKDVADEILISIDSTTTDNTEGVVESFEDSLSTLWPVVHVKKIQSPMQTGFDAARNESIKDASGDWILWIDADEVLVHGNNIKKYLRNNMYKGYATKQHHFSVEPLGVQRTDIPCRLFRNNIGIRFFGMVHEHPETEFNKSVYPAMLIPDIDIAHYGYTTDDVRIKRFERNIGLLVQDRKKYPDRKLGKALWIRDLAQMCKFEIQKTMQLSQAMVDRAHIGKKLFEEMIDDKDIPSHMLLDCLEFYSMLIQVIDPNAEEVGFSVDVSKLNGGTHPENNVFKGRFLDSSIANNLMTRLLKEKAGYYESRYF